MTRCRAALGGLLLALAGAMPATAQAATMTYSDDQGNGLVTLRLTVSGGARSGSGIGFARFDVDNVDDQPHDLEVALTSPRFGDADVATRRSLTVEPGSTRFFLPVAIPPVRGRLEASFDGSRSSTSINFQRGNGVVGLFVSDRSGSAPAGLQLLSAMPAESSRVGPEQVLMQARDLPTDWRLLTSFSAILVDGRAALTGELQEAVRRYAFAGGKVVVAHPDSLPAGSLRERCGEPGVARHGFGHVAVVPRLEADADELRRALAPLPRFDEPLWPARRAMFPELDIAGLGEAPVVAFVLVILAFAILVGPVNFWILRRRRKPLLALVTVPLAGFGTTIAILGYGIFHDGFGARGAEVSWTLLDQGRRESVSVSMRTLFAGLAPSELTMQPDSLLLSWRAGRDNDDWADRWHWDADAERLDGGVLPSRTVTPLLSVRQGAARARLTLRQSGDVLEMLTDGGIEPVGEVVLRDLQGDYWRGEDGALQKVGDREGRALLRALVVRSSQVRAAEWSTTVAASQPLLLDGWDAPGSYAAEVAAAPWLDDHGLSVDYDSQQHFVFGRLYPQDFVR